jgi:hypothetical protein
MSTHDNMQIQATITTPGFRQIEAEIKRLYALAVGSYKSADMHDPIEARARQQRMLDFEEVLHIPTRLLQETAKGTKAQPTKGDETR